MITIIIDDTKVSRAGLAAALNNLADRLLIIDGAIGRGVVANPNTRQQIGTFEQTFGAL
jgi:hypothetical protein